MHTVCRKCHGETPSGEQLCASCEGALMADLRAVEDVVQDLLITRTKQDRVSTPSRVSGTREAPLAFRPGALTAEEILHETLHAWACVIHAQAYGVDDVKLPGDSKGLADFLRRHPLTILRCESAAELCSEIAYALSNARKAVDRPAEKRFAGRCVCAELLYAYEHSRFVTCPTCGERFEVSMLQAGVLVAVRQYVGTAAEIASGIGDQFGGGKISRKLINQWHSRGRLAPRDFTPNGDPMFLVADVLDLARKGTPPGAAPA